MKMSEGKNVFNNNMNKNFTIITLVIICVIGVAGLLGMIFHGAFVAAGGPIWVRSQYIGLWLSSMILFFSLQALYLYFKNVNDIKHKVKFIIDLIYFSICVLLSFIMLICYGIIKNADATIWSLILVLINSTSIFIIVMKNKSVDNTNVLSSEDVDKTKKGKCKSCVMKTLPVLNWISKVLFLLFLGLLTAGSVINGGLSVKYPPRGKFIKVSLEDNTGRTLNIHYLCDGPINNSYPVYMFEGSGSHGLMDYYGLQTVLKEKGKRSCIWDNAGLGYSDYLYTDMNDAKLYYHTFFSSIGEKPPFIYVGWGGGGATVFNYASKHPEMVYSITFLDVSPARVEWLTPKVLKNWTQIEYDNYVNADMSSRYTLFGIINGLGVPWGLMTIFVSKSKAYPSETQDEVTWYFLTDKTWMTQKQYLKLLPTAVDEYNTTTLATNITVYHIMTTKSDSQIISQICNKRNFDTNSNECQYEIKANQLSINWRKNLYNFNGVYNCSLDDCNLGYYVYDSPQFTINTLMNIYANASII